MLFALLSGIWESGSGRGLVDEMMAMAHAGAHLLLWDTRIILPTGFIGTAPGRKVGAQRPNKFLATQQGLPSGLPPELS